MIVAVMVSVEMVDAFAMMDTKIMIVQYESFVDIIVWGKDSV